MRWVVFITIFCSLSCQAMPPSSSNLTAVIQEGETRYQLKNFKMVMPNVLYRGGSSNGESPMTLKSAQALCEDGFSQAIYVYDKNWNYNQRLTVKCSERQLYYMQMHWNRPTEVHQILKNIHTIIIHSNGPMYVHCWHGIHASGYIAAVALMQFCGWSTSQAIKYWNDNVPKKIQYKKVQKMISEFKPYNELLINYEQQSRVCPNNPY